MRPRVPVVDKPPVRRMRDVLTSCKLLKDLLVAMPFLACNLVLAQQVTISLGSGSAAPGSSVTVPVTMTATSGVQPAGLQWTMGYSSTDVSSVTVTAGSSATAAGKTVSCSNTSTSTTCIAYGLNTSAMGSGIVANATSDTVLRFVPPLVVTKADCDRVVATIEQALKAL